MTTRFSTSTQNLGPLQLQNYQSSNNEYFQYCDIDSGFSSCTYSSSSDGITVNLGSGNTSGGSGGSGIYIEPETLPEAGSTTIVNSPATLSVILYEGLILTDEEPRYFAEFEPFFVSDRDDSGDWQGTSSLEAGESGSTYVSISGGSSSGEVFTQDYRAALPKGAEITGIEVSYKYRVLKGSIASEKVDLINCDYTSAGALWDLSAFSYSGNNYTLDAPDNSPSNLHIKPDGAKLYVSDSFGDAVFEYDLSTPYNISTASYNGKVYNASFLITDLYIRSNGVDAFFMDWSTNELKKFTLSSTWDITTASYDGVLLNTTSELDDGVQYFTFSDDGSKLYVGETNPVGVRAIYEYTLSSAWDLSTASYSGNSIDLTTTISNIQSIDIRQNGERMFLTGSDSETDAAVFQYTLTTPWDISSVSYDNVMLSLEGQMTGVRGSAIEPNGSHLYILSTSDVVYQYS